jgi:hypothetical protein
VAGDTYGVIRSYMGSLVGLGPRDHASLHRAFCLTFSAVSLPAQFLPMAIAVARKAAEAAAVRKALTHHGSLPVQEPDRTLQPEEIPL